MAQILAESNYKTKKAARRLKIAPKKLEGMIERAQGANPLHAVQRIRRLKHQAQPTEIIVVSNRKLEARRRQRVQQLALENKIIEAMDQTGGKKRAAAKIVGLSYAAIQKHFRMAKPGSPITKSPYYQQYLAELAKQQARLQSWNSRKTG